MITDKQVNASFVAFEKYYEYHKEDPWQAMRLALEAAEQAAWQPIETAPKDGSLINVYLGNSDKEQIEFYCLPNTKIANGWHWVKGAFRPSTGLKEYIVVCNDIPTHWQPLPEPPKGDK